MSHTTLGVGMGGVQPTHKGTKKEGGMGEKRAGVGGAAGATHGEGGRGGHVPRARPRREENELRTGKKDSCPGGACVGGGRHGVRRVMWPAALRCLLFAAACLPAWHLPKNAAMPVAAPAACSAAAACCF